MLYGIASSKSATLFMALVATLLVVGEPVSACDICAVYTGTLLQHDAAGPWLSVAEQYTSHGTLRVDGNKEPNSDREELSSSTTQIVAGYAFTPTLAAQVSLPLISREFRRAEHDGSVRGDESGVGDMAFVARYAPLNRVFEEGVVRVELLAGLKVPTGDSSRLKEEQDDHHEERVEGAARASATRGAGLSRLAKPRHGEEETESAIHGHDLALGSGSVDGLLGLAGLATWRRGFATAHMQYGIRGNGDYGYEYADDFTWSGGPGVYALLGHPYTIGIQAQTSGEVTDDDTNVYVGPALLMTYSHHLSADFAADVPVYQDAVGAQLVADYRLRGGISWRF